MKKTTKTILAAALAFDIGAPVATTYNAQPVQAAAKQSYTQAEWNYVIYNGGYFSVQEKAGYNAKSFYFHTMKSPLYVPQDDQITTGDTVTIAAGNCGLS